MEKKFNNGFTLIETLVYLALLSLVFTGLFAAGFAIVESVDALKTRAIVQEEGNFILAKINWAVVGAQDAWIDSGSLVLDEPDHTVSFDPATGDMLLDSNILNTQIVRVKDVNFEVTGASPEIKVSAEFKVYGVTSMGKPYEQPFEITNYLRK